jgi:ubiquinone/menaquinone biosynthesis C-methylase UbiE
MGLDGSLPYPDENFDVFIASEVLEHLDDQQLSSTVAEMHRVLRQGGHALLTFPARERLKENECYCPHCGETFHKWGHKQQWNEQKIRQVFKDFAIERLGERYFMPLQLNAFGRIEGYARIILSKFRRMSNMTFFVILRK